jgi:hypothetical protein
MCHGMEFRRIRPCGWLGKGLGRLERGWSVPGMELWIGESDGRKQVRQKPVSSFQQWY